MKSTLNRILSLLLIAALFLSSGVSAFGDDGALPMESSGNDSSPIVNILLLGVDEISDGKEKDTRSDCMMICSLNRDTGNVKLVSIERAIYVEIPGIGKDLLTYAHHYGGPELVQQLIEEYFHIDLAGYVEIDYDGFMQVVDALGGVDVELTRMEMLCLNGDLEEYYPENGAWAWEKMVEGMNHLTGHDALMYCRLRAIDSDWHRVERQRTVIQLLADKAKNASLSQIIDMVRIVLSHTRTNLPVPVICSLLARADRFKGAVAEQMTVPVHSNPIVCDYPSETIRLHNFIYGDTESEKEAE